MSAACLLTEREIDSSSIDTISFIDAAYQFSSAEPVEWLLFPRMYKKTAFIKTRINVALSAFYLLFIS